MDNRYDFLDAYRGSVESKKTIRQFILDREAAIEDPRVPEELRVKTIEKNRQRLFADEMRRLMGSDHPRLFKDNAPTGAFPTNALERLDMNIRHQPLKTYAMRDIPIQYGGGALESIKGFKEMYQLPKGGFIGGDTNQVRLVNVEFQAQYVPVKPLTYGLRLGYIDELKNQQLGYDAISKNAEAIVRAWNLDLDRIGYVGTRGENGSTTDVSGNYRGLLNQENVTTTDLETTTDYTLTEKNLIYMDINTAIEIFIGELNDIAAANDWDERYIPNKMLFFKEYFEWLNKTAQNTTNTGTPFRTNKDILAEALNTWCDTQGFDRISLVMLPYLSYDISSTKDASMVSSGTNDTGRIVLYRQDPYVNYLPLPLDLTSGALVYDINTNAYRRNYVSFVGYLMLFQPTSMRYIDNGSTRATDTTVTDAMQDLIDGTSITSLTFATSTGVLTHIATYPDTIDSSLAAYYHDAIVTFDDALPTGTIVSALTYEGSSLTATELDLGGRTSVWLSDLASETLRNLISGHAGSSLTMTFTISGNATAIDTTMHVTQYVSNDNFITKTAIASKSQDIELAADES